MVTDSTLVGTAKIRLPLISALSLSAYCGLVAGLAEVGTIVIRKHTFDPNHLYGMTRHFVWLIPVTNVCIFTVLGSMAWILGLARPRGIRWFFPRALCALAFLPLLLVTFPRVHDAALVIVAVGAAVQVVPLFERNRRAFHRVAKAGFPTALGVLAVLAAAPWIGDKIRERRENSRPMPTPGSPNILLIVLDSVAAGHLSLHGYNRETSPTLVELAERGIRFDRAIAPSSWTLPSQATMFTGRWLHELSVGWLTPLDNATPTLAEFLGARGYATAGVVANTEYCAWDSGLARGFTHYQDFIFHELSAFRPAVLVNHILIYLKRMNEFLAIGGPELARLRSYLDRLELTLEKDRKEAAVVNREILDWLTLRKQPERPFFAFLNYFDAHFDYQLPNGHLHRFGEEPRDRGHRSLIRDWWWRCRLNPLPIEVDYAVAAYDDCVADLDERVGMLLDELELRGLLKHTWVFITSDHGESFGEHRGVFCHGRSVYQTEVHVPLLVIPPGGTVTNRVVKDTVSLRDLAATVVDVTGLKAGAPFPGDTLARFWSDAAPARHASSDPALAELARSTGRRSRDLSVLPRRSWPQEALTQGDWSYIHREGNHTEELFDLGKDPGQQHNLAEDRAAQPVLERMRSALVRITGGPLLPTSFSP